MLVKERLYDEVTICPECDSTDTEFLGPSDYTRERNGDYTRKMSYRCKKCKAIFNK
jgi:hypothetical protein